ncbi:hypothetical protein [Methylomonas methanica]|uniref:hypothetical protein n=1 Tax=Methylomonas methanica TaxID=421 RepID=UPI000AC8783B|nr:hypothetical protein [Methylomonas methanica]
MAARKPTKKVKKARIFRAVASSSAIETGQSVQAIEQALKSNNHKFRDLELAD